MTTAEYIAWKKRLGIRPARRSHLFCWDIEMSGSVKADSPYISANEHKPKPPPITEDLSRFIIKKNATQLWWARMSKAERRRQCAKRKANALKRKKQ